MKSCTWEWLLLGTGLLALSGCTAPAPDFCENNSECNNGLVCSADNRCIRPIDAGDDHQPSDAKPGEDGPLPPDAASMDAPQSACDPGFACLAAVSGWTGPVAVGEGTSCPAAYPTSTEVIHRDLSAPPASCACNCSANAECELHMRDPVQGGGGVFAPTESCQSPPVEDVCLSASVDASCNVTDSSSVPNVSWGTTAQVCDGATSAGTCDGGTCLPQATDFGSLCIVREGDHACPADTPYTERTLYFQDFTDNRGCTACGCQTTGWECELDLEICSVSFFQVTLNSGDGDEECLNSSNGDGVTILSQGFTQTGTCSTTGGAATGGAEPEKPFTVCCTP